MVQVFLSTQYSHHFPLVMVRSRSSTTVIMWELFHYGLQATSDIIISHTCGEEASRVTRSLKKGLDEFRVLIHHLRLTYLREKNLQLPMWLWTFSLLLISCTVPKKKKKQKTQLQGHLTVFFSLTQLQGCSFSYYNIL